MNISKLIGTVIASLALGLAPLRAADQFVAVNLRSIGITNVSCYSWASAWGDYDNDGYIDLYVGNTKADGSGYVNFLYHNNGNGTFTRKFASEVGPPADDVDPTYACAWADSNNDGLLDLLSGGAVLKPIEGIYGKLYQNQGGGRFVSVTGGDFGIPRFIAVGTFADYDNDGWVDLFLGTQFVSDVMDVRTNILLHGRGDGIFRMVTDGVVVTDELDEDYANDPTWGDFNNDGLIDLIVTHWQAAPFVYRNDGNGQFTRMTNSVLEKMTNMIGHAVWGDYDNDGSQDLAVAGPSLAHLFHNDGMGNFVDARSFPSTEWGLPAWVDYDNDGYLDLYIARGQGSSLVNRLFHNNGDGTWTSVTDAVSRSAADRFVGAWGDYDNDGFLDLWLNSSSGSNALYHNLGHASGNTNHWVKFVLVGTASNRSATGAKVRVKATIGGKTFWQMRELSAGGAYGEHDLRPNFGLGDATNVDLVRIEWPSSLVQEFQNVAADQILTITEHQEGAGGTPALTATRSLDGTVQLALTGQANLLYVLEGSSDLVNWAKLGVRTNLTGTVAFTDVFATNYARRFYRGVAP